MRFKRIYIEITNICNLSCSFCPPHHREARMMQWEECQRILAQIKPYTQYIYLHVKGEPMLHPDFEKMVKYAHQEGFFVNVTTNATMLSEHLGITPYIRQLNISLHATNRPSIVAIAKEIHDCIVNYRIWNKSLNAEAVSLLEEAYHVKLPDTPNFTLDKNHFVSQAELFEWPDQRSKCSSSQGYCHALSSQIAILADGTVVPCCLDHQGEIPLGNLFQQNFADILASPKVLAIQEGFRRRIAICELCQKCTYKNRF